MNRALLAARRVAVMPRAAVLRAPVGVRRMGGGGHGDSHGDDHHHAHNVFDPPFDGMGMPAAVFAFVVFGGLGTIGIAVSNSQSKWVPPK